MENSFTELIVLLIFCVAVIVWNYRVDKNAKTFKDGGFFEKMLSLRLYIFLVPLAIAVILLIIMKLFK